MLSFPYFYKDAQPPASIVTWADGTDEEIAMLLAAANAGEINLSDYWSIGDERVIHLSAMTATNVGETHAEQNAVFVLMDTGANSGYKDVSNKTVNFVVGLKDCLNEKGYMNSTATNSGGWNSAARRTWCNNTFRNALPASIRGIFKQFRVPTASTIGATSLTTSSDYFALFANKEITGFGGNSNTVEASTLTQIEWYKTSANRKKNANGANSNWWGRSVADGPFQATGTSFIPYNDSYYMVMPANNPGGLSPFGCI